MQTITIAKPDRLLGWLKEPLFIARGGRSSEAALIIAMQAAYGSETDGALGQEEQANDLPCGTIVAGRKNFKGG